MTIHDAMHERGRSLEEDFFRRRDRELVEKIRKAAEAEASRQGLGQKTGLDDPALLAELQELGFTPDTVVLLPIVPAVQMAWAEGGVTRDEAELLLALARARGVTDGSPAHTQLQNWIATRPDDEVFARAGRLIAAVLASGGETAANLTAADLVANAERIASASGGLFGLGRVSVEEKNLLAQIKADLDARRR
jgi:hypothetical protein